MSTLKSIVLAVFVLAAVVLPVGAIAQTPWWCNSSFGSWWGTNCNAPSTGQGGLLVYVQVLQNSYGQPTPTPSDFSVSVFGNQPTPAIFNGSLSGSPVVLEPGSYSATIATNAFGYQPQYSAGCSGDIAGGEHKLCVITMHRGGAYLPYTTSYPYPYTYQPLTCSPQNQTVSLGGVGHFTATGGTGGSYSWQTSTRSYPNAGPVLNATFAVAGTQNVTVTSGSQTATCSVNVVVTPGYSYSAPIQSGYAGVYPNVVYTSTAPTYSDYSYAYPKLPNTGVEPGTAGAAAAFASVLLMALGIAAYPYARKSFAVVGR